MTSAREKPMRSRKGMVSSIMPDNTAPERRPKVRTVFFIERAPLARSVATAAMDVVIRSDDFGFSTQNHPIGSGMIRRSVRLQPDRDCNDVADSLVLTLLRREARLRWPDPAKE